MRRRIMFILALVGLLAAPPPATALVYSRVTLATTATLIVTAPPAGTGTIRILIRNPSAVSIYLGDVNVTTANGFEIAAGDSIGLPLAGGDKLYGIVAAATQVIYTITGANPS